MGESGTEGLTVAICKESERCKRARGRLLDLAASLPRQPTGEDLAAYAGALDDVAHLIDSKAMLIAQALVHIAAERRALRAELLRLIAGEPQRYKAG
jgi:hypothetical protein